MMRFDNDHHGRFDAEGGAVHPIIEVPPKFVILVILGSFVTDKAMEYLVLGTPPHSE